MADTSKRITDVEYIEALFSDESFFVNQNNAIKQIEKKDLVFDIVNGGTGATNATDALKNLGINVTSNELNKLQGINATASELNHVSGVTSNIQEQLNNMLQLTIGEKIILPADLDTFTDIGKFYSENSETSEKIVNTPTTDAGFGLIVMEGYITGRVYQIAFTNVGEIIVRYYNGTNWNEWNRLTGNILSSKDYGASLPEAGTVGRIFYKKVQ